MGSSVTRNYGIAQMLRERREAASKADNDVNVRAEIDVTDLQVPVWLRKRILGLSPAPVTTTTNVQKDPYPQWWDEMRDAAGSFKPVRMSPAVSASLDRFLSGKSVIDGTEMDGLYWVPKKNLSADELAVHRARLTIQPSKKAKAYNEGASSLILFQETDTHIKVPLPYGARMWGRAEIDRRTPGTPMSPDCKFDQMSLRPKQRDWCNQAIAQFRNDPGGAGILKIPCGEGKTATAIAISIYNNVCTAFAVTRIAFLQKTVDQIHKFAPAARVGIVHRDIFDVIDKDFIVVSVDTVLSKKYGPEHFKMCGFFIYDEVHHIAARTHSRLPEILGACKARLGLSATPFRQDVPTSVLYDLMGPIIVDVERPPRHVTCHIVTYRDGKQDDIPMANAITRLSLDKRRTYAIVRLMGQLMLDRSLVKSRHALIMSERRVQIAELSDTFLKYVKTTLGRMIMGPAYDPETGITGDEVCPVGKNKSKGKRKPKKQTEQASKKRKRETVPSRKRKTCNEYDHDDDDDDGMKEDATESDDDNDDDDGHVYSKRKTKKPQCKNEPTAAEKACISLPFVGLKIETDPVFKSKRYVRFYRRHGSPPITLFSVGTLVGSLSAEEQDAACECDAVFAIRSIAKENLDIVLADTLIEASPTSQHEQSNGRILRISEHKNDPLVYYFSDPFGMFYHQTKKAIREYTAAGYDIKYLEAYPDSPNIPDRSKASLPASQPLPSSLSSSSSSPATLNDNTLPSFFARSTPFNSARAGAITTNTASNHTPSLAPSLTVITATNDTFSRDTITPTETNASVNTSKTDIVPVPIHHDTNQPVPASKFARVCHPLIRKTK